MAHVKQIEPDIFIGGQIQPTGLAALAAAGIVALVNNRPDHEEPGQPTGEALRAAAQAAGIAYIAAPIAGGIPPDALEALAKAHAAGPVLAFCKSGMRSAAAWAVLRASEGADPNTLIAAARAAGQELGGLRGLLVQAGRGQLSEQI